MSAPEKPLGQKAYGHIAHLPGSRMGPGDHKCHEGQARIATERVRDKHDRVFVQEKMDGSCVSVALLDGVLHPLGRAGYPARTSPHEQHWLFDAWVWENEDRFRSVLRDGERIVGEWLAMAHGTRYDLTRREPFVAFDIMRGTQRAPVEETLSRALDGAFWTPATNHSGPMSIGDAMAWVGTYGFHGALDPVEGVVWRVERHGKVDFLVKYVRPDKVDGSYFENGPVWNWRPAAERAA